MNAHTSSPMQASYSPHLRHKYFIMALVTGLALRVHLLASDGTLLMLSTERRVILVLIALRLLTMMHSSIGITNQEQVASQVGKSNWQETILPGFIIIPTVVLFWLAAWETRGPLIGITGYAIAVTIILLFWLINIAVTLVKSTKRTSTEKNADRRQNSFGKSALQMMFYSAYGVIIGVGIVAWWVLSPESLDDLVLIGNITLNAYLLIWAVQAMFSLLSNLVRQATREAGSR